nr:serine/threonine-protein kinase [Mycobacterium vicinigordonae]
MADGTPFGRYRLLDLLGRGGMGEVWRAHDTTIDRVVAVKTLLPHFAEDQKFEQRFRREARLAARLENPHVVPIYDVGEIDGRLFVAMRLIAGQDLQQLLEAGPLPPERAVQVIGQVAKALDAAHKAGLVHRDVKPSNILLGDDDFAYLIDFGIARATGESGLTSTGTTIGTWSYMAPERFSTGAAGASSDIYALACMLYQCLTGQLPFPAVALEQIAVAHMTSPPPRPSTQRPGIPTAIDAVIATGLAKDPAQRYATATELASAAHNAITTPITQHPAGPASPQAAKAAAAPAAIPGIGVPTEAPEQHSVAGNGDVPEFLARPGAPVASRTGTPSPDPLLASAPTQRHRADSDAPTAKILPATVILATMSTKIPAISLVIAALLAMANIATLLKASISYNNDLGVFYSFAWSGALNVESKSDQVEKVIVQYVFLLVWLLIAVAYGRLAYSFKQAERRRIEVTSWCISLAALAVGITHAVAASQGPRRGGSPGNIGVEVFYWARPLAPDPHYPASSLLLDVSNLVGLIAISTGFLLLGAFMRLQPNVRLANAQTLCGGIGLIVAALYSYGVITASPAAYTDRLGTGYYCLLCSFLIWHISVFVLGILLFGAAKRGSPMRPRS